MSINFFFTEHFKLGIFFRDHSNLNQEIVITHDFIIY